MKVKVVEGVWGNSIALDYRRAKRPSNKAFAVCVALDLVTVLAVLFGLWWFSGALSAA